MLALNERRAEGRGRVVCVGTAGRHVRGTPRSV